MYTQKNICSNELNELRHKYFVWYVLKFEEQLFQEGLYINVF